MNAWCTLDGNEQPLSFSFPLACVTFKYVSVGQNMGLGRVSVENELTLDIYVGFCGLDDGGLSSDEEFSGGDVEALESQAKTEDRELKERLLRMYGSHINSLKMEFSKKKKKGKLPKEARQTLLEWWNVHYKWPYPTVSLVSSYSNLAVGI